MFEVWLPEQLLKNMTFSDYRDIFCYSLIAAVLWQI